MSLESVARRFPCSIRENILAFERDVEFLVTMVRAVYKESIIGVELSDMSIWAFEPTRYGRRFASRWVGDENLNITTDRMDSNTATDGARSYKLKQFPGWALFAGGFAVGLVVVHLGITRPMIEQFARLQGQVGGLERGMNKLAGHRDGTAKTNDLLSLLAKQSQQTEAAARAFQGIQSLESRLVNQQGLTSETTRLLALLADQGRQTEAAVEALRGIQSLESQLVEQQGLTAETTRLLELLADQGRQAHVAAGALDDIRSLEEKLIAQQSDTVEAHTALASLHKIRDEAIEVQESSADIADALERLGDLQDRITQQYHSIQAAEQTLAAVKRLRAMAQAEGPHVAKAQQALDALIRLKNATLAGADQMAWAGSVVEEWAKINDRIAKASADTGPARQAADELLALKDNILRGSDPRHPEQAREALDELVKIRETLHGQAGEVAEARTQLDGLVGLKRSVLAQTGDLADAVETLETAADLHHQFEDTVQSFDRVRRWMTDVLMFESTVERAVAAIKPLVELTNLRRMSAVELRQAARSITEGRKAARLAEKASAAGQAKVENAGASRSTGGALPLDAIQRD